MIIVTFNYIIGTCQLLAKKIEDESKDEEIRSQVHINNITLVREKLRRHRNEISNIEQSFGINKTDTFDKVHDGVNQASTTNQSRTSFTSLNNSIYNKTDFRGLVITDCSLPFIKKKKQTIIANGDDIPPATSLGFPFPEYSGIPTLSLNKPLSESVDLSKVNSIETRLRIAKESRKHKQEEIRKKREELEAESDIKV